MRKIVIVNALVLLAGLAVVELLFGTWLSQGSALYHFTLPRNVTLRYKTSLPGQPETTTYTRDGNGLRGRYRSLDGIFMLTVGGSTTDQRYVSDGLTFQDRLAALYAASGRPVEIVNAGVDGQSTFGHLAAFDYWLHRLPGLKPRYVLLYVGINDFYNFGERAGYDRVSGNRWLSLKTRIEEKSALVALYRIAKGAARPADVAHRMGHGIDNPGAWPMTSEQRAKTYDTPEIAASLGELATRLKDLVAKVRQIGAEPILVTQRSVLWRKTASGIVGVRDWSPDAFSPALKPLGALTGVDRYHLERRQADAILAVCREAGGICLDLAADLDPDPATDFYDAFHTTPKGSERIARYLFDKLGSLR